MAAKQHKVLSVKSNNESESGVEQDARSESVTMSVNGHASRNDWDASETDDGPESPDSIKEATTPIVKKKSNSAKPHEGSNTADSTPDKRECRCQLCSGAHHIPVQGFLREDGNQNIDSVDVEHEEDSKPPKIAQLNGVSSDEGIPTENGLYSFGDYEHLYNGCQDGMDNYFRENEHLFEQDNLSNGHSTPEAGPRNESLRLDTPALNGVTSWGVGDYVTMTCSSSRHSGMQSSNGYGSDKGSHRGSDYDSDEGGVYVLPDDVVACSKTTTLHNDSSEDQGDFIEMDIPKNPYACSGDSSNSDSRRNSVSSSYEDLRQSNIFPPNSSNWASTDEGSFTKLVFNNRDTPSTSQTQEQLRHRYSSYQSPVFSAASVRGTALSNAPVLRPTNLFDGHLQSDRAPEQSNIMFTSASTESSSPFTMSSANYMSSPYSDNSNSALNAPTSESSVFVSPDRETPSNSASSRRREAFLRNQSMDNGPSPSTSPCPLRPAKSSGDLEQPTEDRDGREEEFCSAQSAALTMSRSLHQNLSHQMARARRTAAMLCRHCNKQHTPERSILRRSGSAGVSVVEGNEQSQLVLPDDVGQRSNSEELLDRDSVPPIVCLSCHRRRFGTFSCDRNDCDVLETAQKKHEFCLHGRCTCSLSYYFHCVMDTSSDPGSMVTLEARSNSSQSNLCTRPRVNSSSTTSQNKLSPCNQHTNNLSRRMHHYIHHLHDIEMVSANNPHSSASNNSGDENNLVSSPPAHVETRGFPARSFHHMPSQSQRLGNLAEMAGEDQQEHQENQNNDNITRFLNHYRGETHGRGSRPLTNNDTMRVIPPSNPAISGQSCDEQLARDRGMRRDNKSRSSSEYVQHATPRNSGIRILPLLLRSANTIDEMDPEAVMELRNMLHNEDESEDDGYVDFQKILRDYMVHKLYEKHSVTAPMYRCCGEAAHAERLDPAMIWSEYQAYLYHERQIGVSACGATAAINVLRALNVRIEQEAVCAAIKTNLRDETASVPQYLLSRSVAGSTAEQLLRGVETCTEDSVTGRFFHMYPPRKVCLRHWLKEWIKKGAVPLVTLNLQKAVPSGYDIPDAWHHQMVYGVSQQGVFLTNPQEIVPEHVLNEQLSSEGVLLIQRKDVISRWRTENCDLRILMNQSDPRWRTLNVIGQVVNVIREQSLPHHSGFRPQLTDFINIPAWYKAGVTLFMCKSNPHWQELSSLPELALQSNWKKEKRKGK